MRMREGYPHNAQSGITNYISLTITEFNEALNFNSGVC